MDFMCSREKGFCVPYELRESPGRGLGLFAAQYIPANTLLWKFEKGHNIRVFETDIIVRQHLSSLASEDEKRFWVDHVYMCDGVVYEILDDGKYWNHDSDPNCGSGYMGDWDSTYSLREINAGEEFLDDYRKYEHPEWLLQLYDEYNVPYNYFLLDHSQPHISTSSGFQIKYEIKESSPIMGLGIFTTQFIPKGTLIWKYKQNENVLAYKGYEAVKQRLAELNKEEQDFFMSHVYLYDGVVNEIIDDGKFWNHSESPNTGYGSSSSTTTGEDIDWNSSYAMRDIQAGEELLDDYGIYEYPPWFIQLAQEYNIPQDFIIKKDSIKPSFHIQYEVKESSAKGLGIFATQNIPANTLVWKSSQGNNIQIIESENIIHDNLKSLSTIQDKCLYLNQIIIRKDGTIIQPLDDYKYINHSTNSNLSNSCSERHHSEGIDSDEIDIERYCDDIQSSFSSREIAAGEELVENYLITRQFPSWLLALYDEYGVDYSTFKSLIKN
eukprot:gene10141-21152_t